MKKMLLLIFLLINIISFGFDEKTFMNCSIEKIQGSFISVKLNNNKVEIIKLAPPWYIEQNGILLNYGEKIQIKYIEINSYKVVTELIKQDISYRFIDEEGEFIWTRKGMMGEHRQGHMMNMKRKEMMK